MKRKNKILRSIFIPNITLHKKENYTEKQVDETVSFYQEVIDNKLSVATIRLDDEIIVMEVRKDCVTQFFIKIEHNGDVYVCEYNTKARGENVTISAHLEKGDWTHIDIESFKQYIQGIIE